MANDKHELRQQPNPAIPLYEPVSWDDAIPPVSEISINEWEQIVKAWNSLPNAKYINEFNVGKRVKHTMVAIETAGGIDNFLKLISEMNVSKLDGYTFEGKLVYDWVVNDFDAVLYLLRR